jgi:hypothetical protein
MIRRRIIRRLERLETRMSLKRQRLRFHIAFVAEDGSASTLVLDEKDDPRYEIEHAAPGPRDPERR